MSVSVEGLQAVANLNKTTNDQNQDLNRQDAAVKAADLFKSGDYEGAMAEISRYDPEHAGQLLTQARTINPKFAQSLKQAESSGTTRGEFDVTTEHGSNPRQLQDARIQAEKEKGPNARDVREGRLSSQFNQGMAFKYQQAAEGSPTYKSAISVINEMPQLKSLLDDAYKNGGQSLAMLGPRIAKGLAGEVGVLTEQDVTRYIRNPAVANWLISGATKQYEGKLTQQDYTNLMRLGVVMGDAAEKKLAKAYDQAATKMSRNLGIPLEDAQLLVNPTLDEGTKSTIMEQHGDRIELGTVIKGHKYIGGDKHDPKNWVKEK